MTIIYYLNITASALLMFWPMWFARTQLRLGWINPFSIILVIALPVELMKLFGGPLLLIEDGLLDTGYQYSLLMFNLLTLAQLIGTLFFFSLSKLLGMYRILPLQNVFLDKRDLKRSSYFFLLFFVISMTILANAEFGVLNWIMNPREGYQLYRTGQGHWYALATTSLSVSFVLSCLARPSIGGVIGSTVFFIFLGYFLGSKGVLLSIFSTTLVFLWFLRWRYLNCMILAGGPVLFVLMVFNLYLARGDGFELLSIIEYFDYFKNAADYYRSYLNHETSLFHGEVFLSSFWSYVPRYIWPDKPVIYGTLLVNEIFYPGMAELTNTPAFGGAVDQFADFGPLGVAIFGFFSTKSILMGLLSYYIFLKPGLSFKHVTLATVLLIIVQYAPAFGNYFPGGLYLLLVFGIIIILRTLRYSRKYSVPKIQAVNLDASLR